MGPDITIFYTSLLANIKKNNIHFVSTHIDRFKNLPGKRFDFNDQDMFGKTLAHYLVEHLNTLDVNFAASIVDKFLTLGIDLNIKDVNGKLAIDLCSKDAARATVLEKLIQYKASHPNSAIKKPILERLAEDPTAVIMGSIDGKNTRNYLEGFPHIYECHCCDVLSREPDVLNFRKDFEDNTLKYLKDIPGENEITIVGSGNLLDTLVLIAKFKKDNPGSTLRLNLVEKGYEANNALKMKELFADFTRCMKENNIKLTVSENQTNIPVSDVANDPAGLNLTISLQNDFKKYLELHRTPKLLIAADLDCEQYGLQQHQIVANLAQQAQAKAFVSISTGSLKKDLVVAPAPPKPVAAAAPLANAVKVVAEQDKIAAAPVAPVFMASAAPAPTPAPPSALPQQLAADAPIKPAEALIPKPKAVTPLHDSTKSAPLPAPVAPTSDSPPANPNSPKKPDPTPIPNPEKPGPGF